MQKLFLILLFVAGCVIHGDNEPKKIIAVWDPNVEPDVTHYRFYFWQGSDATNWDPTDLQYLYDVPHNAALDSIVTDSITITLDYFAVGAVAVDSDTNMSNMAFSPIYRYHEFWAPSPPQYVRAKK